MTTTRRQKLGKLDISPELREAVSRKFKWENGLDYKPEEIMITSGASEALHVALEALCGKGDEVLVPDPGFVSDSALTVMADAKPVSVPLGEKLKYDPDDDALHLEFTRVP
jgi:aspartate aminotransferase